MSTSAKDARAFRAVTLGDGQPLVPDDAQAQGSAAVVAAALKRLAALKRPRTPMVYHRAPDASDEDKACPGRYNTETDQ